MVNKMRNLYPLIAALLPALLAGCAENPVWKANEHERFPVNAPALTADLQAIRSAGDFRTVQNRYARSVSLTVMKALETYVPTEYTVFPDPGVDLSRPLLLDRSRTWFDALPAALRGAGIETKLDPVNKTIRLIPSRPVIPTTSS